MDNRKAGEILMAICAEAPGCFEIDPESLGPLGSCVYSELTQLGYTSDGLESADGKDATSINCLYNLIYPDCVRDHPLDKMHPECLKLASIIQKCKFKHAALTAENAVGEEEKDAYSLSYIHQKIGEFGRKSCESAPGSHKPNGWLRERASSQVARNSLEWAPLGEVLEREGVLSQFKNNISKIKLVTFSGWALKILNEFGHSPADPDSIKHDKRHIS